MDYNCLFNLSLDKKILVIGDIMIDTYQYGSCNRISPEAPVPVVIFENEEKMLGGAGNVLKNLISFGVECELVSVVGSDSNGSVIINKIEELGISTESVIIDKTRTTTEKKRVVVSGQQLLRIDNENTHQIDKQIEDKVVEFVRSNISKYDVIIFSDYLKGLLTHYVCISIIEIANRNSVLTLVDPKGKGWSKYKNADLIKPNLKEAEIITTKIIKSHDDIMNACFKLKEMLNCKFVVITLAEDGMALLDDKFSILPTVACQVFDVSGAGDTVIASLAVCLKQNLTLSQSTKFANKAASIVIRKFGSNTTTIEEVINSN